MTQRQLEALAAGNPRVAERMRTGQYAERVAETREDPDGPYPGPGG